MFEHITSEATRKAIKYTSNIINTHTGIAVLVVRVEAFDYIISARDFIVNTLLL
jgi:hypothetical protein